MSSTITKEERMRTCYGRSIVRYGKAICFAFLMAGVHMLQAQTTSNALDFDGDDDYVQLPAAHYFTQNSFTIEAWIYPRSYNLWSRVIDFSNGPGSDNVLMAITDGTSGKPAGSIFNGGNGTNFTANTTLALDTWSHLAIVVNGSDASIYINGERNATFTNINLVNDIERTLNYIGKSAFPDDYADMILDELKIWNRVLTRSHIANNMYKKPAAGEADLLVYFDFDQGTQGGDNTSITSLTDKSGNDYHGEFNNFTLDGTGSNFVAGIDISGEASYPNLIAPNLTTPDATISKNLQADDFTLTATSSSLAPIIYSIRSGTSVSLDGATVSVEGTGTSVVRIHQNPESGYDEDYVDVTINVVTVPADLPATTVPQSPGFNPISIANGDLNGDGFKDMAVTFQGTHNVIVYINDGTGAFSKSALYAVGSNPRGIVAGDLDGDGDLDLATANFDAGTVSVLINMGTGTFNTQVEYEAGSGPISIVSGDLDGDGKLDMATANYSASTVSVFTNAGTGTFNTQVEYGAGVNPQDIVIGDLDGDDKLDLATADGEDHTVSVLINTGSGDFNTRVPYAAGSNPYRVAIGDLDGDDKLDLATTNFTNHTVSVLINAGAGEFDTPVQYTVDINPLKVAIDDLDGDGKMDLAVNNLGGNTVSVLINLGTGTFNTHVVYPVGLSPFGLTVGDWNGDAQPDLATANYDGNSLSIILNTGSGVFGNATSINTGYYYTSLAAGDLNGDGKDDLVISTEGNTLLVQINLGNNTYASPVPYEVGSNPYSVAIGDLDGDGKLDLATANGADNTVSVLINTGTGTFNTQVTYEVGGEPQSVAIGDLDSDGKLDLATANSDDNTVSVLINTGTGTFNAQVTYEVGSNPWWIAIGDLDSDGKLDLAMANSYDNTVSVLINTGTGTFNTQVEYGVGGEPTSVAIGDLDGDGKLDLVTANSGDNTVSVLTNTGTGTFDAQATYPTGSYAYSVVIGDLNGDNKADLVIANGDNDHISILNNTGDGFETAVEYSSADDSDLHSAVIANLDGDGRPDLAGVTYIDVFTFLNTTTLLQTISFAPLADKTFGDAVFGLTATASSGLAVTYTSSNTAVATVAGSTITIVGAGTTSITASQTGAGFYTSATPAEQSLSVNKANQTIAFAPLANKTLGDAAFALTATASSSLAVTYTSSNDKVAIISSQVTLAKAGRATIRATQEGNTNFAAATAVEQSFCVNPAKPVITADFTNPTTPVLTSSASSGNQWYHDNVIVPNATEKTLTVSGAGLYTVTATIDQCTSTPSNAVSVLITGITSPETVSFHAYPNPATDYLTIEFSEAGGKQLEIMGTDGKVVHRHSTGDRQLNVDVSAFSPGLYVLKVSSSKTYRHVKFVKK